MLTARTQEMDKVGGLMNGADDYITKPFSPAELLARVDSLYRRVSLYTPKVEEEEEIVEIVLGNFVLDLQKRLLFKNGESIELTQVEFQMMEYFFDNPDIALGRNEILTKVWGSNYFGEEKIVDVNVRRLRMKLEEDPSKPERLLTVWGMGYKWSTR
jgi:DNA-binding response OmpR family regulator